MLTLVLCFAILTTITVSQTLFQRRYHGTNIHFTNPLSGVLDQISSSYSIVRMDLRWSSVEKQIGVYYFSNYDILINSLLSHSPPITPYLIFDYANPLYQNGDAPSTTTSINAFINFVIAAVTRYQKHNIIWEIWNEPNAPYSWKPYPNATAYSILATAVGSSFKLQFPNEILIGPAIAEIDLSFIENIFKYNNSEILNYFDAISVHPYRPDGPETVIPRYQALNDLILKYQNKINQHKVIPIISGEWGYSTCFDNFTNTFIPCIGGARTGVNSYLDQAKYLLRQWVINDFMKVPISIFYDYKNDGDNPLLGEDNFGTVQYEYLNESMPYMPKLAYFVAMYYQSLINDIYRYEMIQRIVNVSCIDCNSEQVYIVEYVAEGEAASTVFIAWYAELNPMNKKSINATVNILNGQKYDDKEIVSCYDMFGKYIGNCIDFVNQTQFVVNNFTDCPIYFTIEPVF